MKFRTLSTLALTSTVLSSCIYYTNPVPDMPHPRYSKATPAAAQPHSAAYTAASQYESSWYTSEPSVLPTATPYSGGYGVTSYTPAASQPPPLMPMPTERTAAIPAPAPAKPSTAITQPQVKLNPVSPKPAVAAKPPAPVPAPKVATSAPKPAAAASVSKDPKSITNTGPIPVATPVPGDPTRVYNPLDSSKTIRITDKNGKIYPSGKELKVRGTNFHFYVP